MFCSFAGRPEFGQLTAATLHLRTPYFKNLKDRIVYTFINGEDEGENKVLVNNSTMWGNVFWVIREKLGQADTDRLLATAWSATFPPAGDFDRTFAAILLKAAGDKAATVHAILADRGFPIPS